MITWYLDALYQNIAGLQETNETDEGGANPATGPKRQRGSKESDDIPYSIPDMQHLPSELRHRASATTVPTFATAQGHHAFAMDEHAFSSSLRRNNVASSSKSSRPDSASCRPKQGSPNRDQIQHHAKQEERTTEMKQLTKASAYKKLMLLIPDVLGPMVGRANAKRGAERMFEMLQNRRLCQELVYRIFDQLILMIFDNSVSVAMQQDIVE